MGKNGSGKLSQWAKIKIVCKVVRGKLQKAHTMGYLTVPGQQGGRGLSRLSTSCPSLNVEGEEGDDEDTPSCKSNIGSPQLTTITTASVSRGSTSSTGVGVGVGVVPMAGGCSSDSSSRAASRAGSRRGSARSSRSEDGENSTTPTTPNTPVTSTSLDDTHLCPDTPKIRVNDSTPTGSEEFLDTRKVRTGSTSDCRRRSWSGLSDDEKKRTRQRSMSLSSVDSDAEEAFYDAEEGANNQGSDGVDGNCRRRAAEKQRSFSGSSSPVTYAGRGGTSSTHSLNDVHLQDKRTTISSSEKPRLLAPRLTLQKSISTPSILAGVTAKPQEQQPQSSYQYEDETASSKRRKRGSIFFRKKKDKLKKSSHQFVSVCYSNSATCDVCSKSMTNKPALRCETCQVCVHVNSCKDQISDCSKLKNPKLILLAAGLTTLVIQKQGGTAGLTSNTKSASLGSNAGVGLVGVGSLSSSSGGKGQPTTRSRSSVTHSSSPTRPHSVATPSGCVASPVRRLSGFSQWKRVATKLGVNKVTSEEKDGDPLHDVPDANMLGTNSASMESLDDDNEESSWDEIDPGDPDLKLLEKEPELWVNTVDKELVSSLTEKQVKKQEHIYELIITEKHHCSMLKVMKKLFVEGMAKELGMQERQIKQIFPCIDELLNIHCAFLRRLRLVQRENKYIEVIGNLLLDQFSGENAYGFKEAYGLFCSQHQDAVSYYKDILKTDRRFQAFIRQRSSHPLMKKKGIPECILFVTQRVTKYPLILEALSKYSKDSQLELEMLQSALEQVKDILVNINAQVAEKERKQRLLEIYHKIDAKSSAMYKEQKFKKSDLLSSSRKLKFEGTAVLSQQRGKSVLVQVVVLSNLVFFLQENNQKYYFVSPDSKVGKYRAGVIPLEKLIVREKAGQDSRAIYLINSKRNAEMFELECSHPKDKRIWIESIKEAIDQCPDEDEAGETAGENNKLQEANHEKIKELTGLLQMKDKEIARVCDDKMNILAELMELLGQENDLPPAPQYRAMLEENQLDPNAAKDLINNSLNEALKLISGACGWGTNLSRSVSSVGEHQSDAYVSPSLPKRAETFGGFDNSSKDNQSLLAKQMGGKKKKDSRVSLTSAGTESEASEQYKNRRPSNTTLAPRNSQDNLSVGSTTTVSSIISGGDGSQQQQAASRLVQCLQTALVLSHHQLTQYDLLRSKVIVGGASIDGRFRHSQKLEELRNIQEQISHERAQWNKERDAQEKWISEKKTELQKLQEHLRREQQDVEGQRETLYRKLEALKTQGIILSPTLAVYTSTPAGAAHDTHEASGALVPTEGATIIQSSPHTSPTGTTPAPRPRADHKHRNSATSLAALIKRDSNPSLPTHLISAANQQKASSVSVKQQLPMKLAKLGGSGGSSSGGGSSSPNQDRPDHKAPPSSSSVDHRTPHLSPSSSAGVQQILPLKLSEKQGEHKGSRMTVGYQRLASPPPSLQEPSSHGPPSHQRTGSSPATLQNGSPTAASPGAYVTSSSSHSSKAARTNTYPKLATKPTAAVIASRSSSGAEVSSSIQRTGDDLGSSTRPGQRMKDPDTNQDIIFF
ncbi:uncharacterized protein LOC143039494 isoform X6 [Oratosquilla oratoria]|uniref:uncharacterized protein LOC143039494 isoform X6 n=1 Tax=Oratosquilla oratoria TaxID=337810 RepID=UPI003F75F41E